MFGTITAIRVDKHFGFIRCDVGGPDAFFHKSDIDPGLDFDERLEEQRVEFTATQTEKGLRARNVRPA